MSKYWSEQVHGLMPYIPGEQPKNTQLIKLNTNENPYPPSPKAITAIKAAAVDTLALYPDPTSTLLREVIAKHFNLSLDQVFVGNGSDEVLAHVFQALFKHQQPLLFPTITYSFYPVYCGLFDITYKQIPLAEDLSLDLAAYAQPNGGIIFPNPNAPTGIALTLDKVEALLANNTDSVVVIDEAYVDFGAESAVSLIAKYPNLLVTQTVSKSRSLAGLRLGYALGDPALIEGLVRVKDSFNSYPIDRLAEAGGIAAIQDVEYFEETRKAVIKTRAVFVEAVKALGFDVLPSAANFVFLEHPEVKGELIAAALRAQNIIVRHFKKPKEIENYLRITIGTDVQMAKTLDVMRSIIASKAV